MPEGNTGQVEVKSTPAAPEPGTPEHDAAMAEAAAKGGVTINGQPAGDGSANKGGEGEKPQRPDHIPEKFWNAEKGEADYEAMAKSYAELEKKLSEKPAEKKDGEKPNDDKAKTAEGDPAALREKANTELTQNGKLSEDTYAAYEKIGITRDQIDGFIEGERAKATLRQHEAFAVVGGEDNYKAMVTWAKSALTAAEVEAYDRDVLTGKDAAVRTNAIKGLAARYEAENGKDGQLLSGAGGAGTGDHFKSKAEMVKAMSDPQYKKDAAYREQVAQKTANALKAGINLGVG